MRSFCGTQQQQHDLECDGCIFREAPVPLQPMLLQARGAENVAMPVPIGGVPAGNRGADLIGFPDASGLPFNDSADTDNQLSIRSMVFQRPDRNLRNMADPMNVI